MNFHWNDDSLLGRETIDLSWDDISQEMKRELRITGKPAYDILFEDKSLDSLERVKAYCKPYQTGLNEARSLENGQKTTLIYNGFRPSANPHPTEDGRIYIVDADTWVSDLRSGNDRYFQRNMEENEEFQDNIFSVVSDGYGDELSRILDGSY